MMEDFYLKVFLLQKGEKTLPRIWLASFRYKAGILARAQAVVCRTYVLTLHLVFSSRPDMMEASRRSGCDRVRSAASSCRARKNSEKG